MQQVNVIGLKQNNGRRAKGYTPAARLCSKSKEGLQNPLQSWWHYYMCVATRASAVGEHGAVRQEAQDACIQMFVICVKRMQSRCSG